MKSVNNSKPKLVCVCGTTASGKTDLAVMLAEFLHSQVICFDSAQVFKFADIGSAKVTNEEKKNIPHQLIDIFEPNQTVQAGSFIDLAETEILRLTAENKLPVLCVGTSLYFRLLLEGIAETGEADPKIRAELESLSSEELFHRLQELDSERAQQLHPNDRLRVIRALEIYLLTGKTATELYAQQQRLRDRYDVLLIILIWPRDKLTERIAFRTSKMMQSGLLQEVQFLSDKYGDNLQIFDSIGYSESLRYLKSQKELEPMAVADLEQQITLHTRQLAKRQLTFWRSFPAKFGFELVPMQPEPADGSKKNQERQIHTIQSDFSGIKSILSDFRRDGGLKAVYCAAEALSIAP